MWRADPEHIIIPLRDMEGNIHPGSLQQDWTEADSVYILEGEEIRKLREQLRQAENTISEMKHTKVWKAY